jgi:hypothetical protein
MERDSATIMYGHPSRREWRKKLLPDRGHLEPKAGWWLQCYSPVMGRWNNIEYLGEQVRVSTNTKETTP